MAKTKEERIGRIEELVGELEQIPNPQSRETAHALMAAILELHGQGLERLMEILFDAGESGKAMIRKVSGDPLVSSLLVLHGLHPEDLETRVQHVLGKLHGHVELISVLDGVVKIRCQGGGLKPSVEAALREAVPDAADVIVEEMAPLNNFVPLASLGVAV